MEKCIGKTKDLEGNLMKIQNKISIVVYTNTHDPLMFTCLFVTEHIEYMNFSQSNDGNGTF